MRVSSITHKNGAGTTLASLVYAYDAGSRLTSETIGGTTTTYTYKTNNDQLESDGTTTWTYDANGNRTSGGSSPTTGNRLTSDGTYTYLYDDESNVTKKTDASGNRWDFKYDQRNQMTEASYFNNSLGTVTSITTYTYGPFGERLKAAHDDTIGSNDFTREFAYDAWNPAKQGGVGNEAFDIWADMDSSHAITTRYFDGDNVDGKLARAVGSAEQWLLGDKLGSIRNITNSSGTLVNTVAYDAWGNVLSQTGSGANDIGRYAFTGRERDVETGLQYNRARYYDPLAGRWQTQDPMGFDAGDSNLNRYVKNAPTNYGDPSGLEFHSLITPIKHLELKDTVDAYGATAYDFKFYAFPYQECGKNTWKIYYIEPKLSTRSWYRTHYYDEWIEDAAGKAIRGKGEFERLKENVDKTEAHERYHIKNTKAWHDRNIKAIEADYDTKKEFPNRAAAEAEISRIEKLWTGRFDDWKILEQKHDTPEWKIDGWDKKKKSPVEHSPKK